MTRSTSNMRKDPDIPNLTLILASSVFVRRGISFINAFLRLSYLYLRLFWRFYAFLSSFYTFLLFFAFTSALIGFLDFLRPPRQLLMLFLLSRGHSTLHLAVSVGMSVGPSVGRSVTFLNSERFSHYCSCPTVRDWIAVYPALLNLDFPIVFLVADTQLYKRLCPSVGRSVNWYC